MNDAEPSVPEPSPLQPPATVLPSSSGASSDTGPASPSTTTTPKQQQRTSWWQRFRTQTLSGWFPIPTAYAIATTYLLLALLLLPFGIATLVTVLNVNQVRVRYDDKGPFARLPTKTAGQDLIKRAPADQRTYNIEFRVTETLHAPVYLYYELSGFFGAYRRYLRSRDENQVYGDGGHSPACNPIRGFPQGGGES